MAVFKFLVAAGELTAGGTLAPVLAPHGLELPRLVREVNDRSTALYGRGTPVRLTVHPLPGRNHRFTLAGPPASRLLQPRVAADGTLPMGLLYALVLRLHPTDPQRGAALLLATLGSCHRPGRRWP